MLTEVMTGGYGYGLMSTAMGEQWQCCSRLRFQRRTQMRCQRLGLLLLAGSWKTSDGLTGHAVGFWRHFGAQLEVVVEKGLADRQVKEIKDLLDQQVNENMGMAMMYTLSEAVREYLVDNNREGNVRYSFIDSFPVVTDVACVTHVVFANLFWRLCRMDRSTRRCYVGWNRRRRPRRRSKRTNLSRYAGDVTGQCNTIRVCSF